MPNQLSSAGQYLPQRMDATSYGLMNLGQSLAQAGAPSPYKQSIFGGLAQGAGGYAQGLQQYSDQQMQDELFRMKQEEAALQKQKLGLETNKAKREEADAAAYEAGAAQLPPPPGVDPAVWATTPAKQKFDLWTSGVTEANKPPFTGAVKDASGNWVYDPDYVAGQQTIGAAGKPVTTIEMPKVEGKFAEAYGAEQGAAAAKVNKDAELAQSTLYDLQALEFAVSQMEAAGQDPGKWAPLVANITAYAQSAGVDPTKLGLPSDAGPAQVALGLSNKLVLSYIGADQGGMPASGFSEADREFVRAIPARIEDTPRGLRMKLEIAKRVQSRKIDLQQMWLDNYDHTEAGYNQFLKDSRAYARANPLFSAEEKAQLSTLVQPAPTSSAPKVGEVQDGFMFKGGDPSDPNSWAKVP